MCVLDTALLSSSSQNTHSCFIRHSALPLNLPVWAINSPTSFLAHYWECECVFGRGKGTERHNEREMCLQDFWYLTPNERRFCCFVQRCLWQACFGSSTGQHLCNDQIHCKAPMIVTSIFSEISPSCSLGIKNVIETVSCWGSYCPQWYFRACSTKKCDSKCFPSYCLWTHDSKCTGLWDTIGSEGYVWC